MSRASLVAIVAVLIAIIIAYMGSKSDFSEGEGGSERGDIVEVVEVVVDTIYYEAIKPSKVEIAPQPISTEQLTEPPTEQTPSLLYTFKDSIDGRWSAQIVGRDVELRSLTLLDKVERHHTTTTQYRPFKWDVALKSGVTPDSYWVGVGVSRNIGRFSLTLDGGYDLWQDRPYIGASAKFTIWREI